MNDLVDRLRNRIHDAPMPTEHMLDEAADRIEALEAALRDISICRYPYAANIAQTALAPEQEK